MKTKHWLRYFFFKDTTWHGQFRALNRLLRLLSPAHRIVIDVGANDGFYSSNSFPFIRRGWRAILIEPHPIAFEAAKRLHTGNADVKVLNLACGDKNEVLPLILYEGDASGSQSTLHYSDSELFTPFPVQRTVPVNIRPLSQILLEEEVPFDFALLSIDAEGQDHRVIQGLDLTRFRPKVIITEGGSDTCPKNEYLAEHGYRIHTALSFDTIWMIA